MMDRADENPTLVDFMIDAHPALLWYIVIGLAICLS
jgi:hypothetical protein